jgi:trans-L-3-hydroxyproline dehydratase
MENILQNFNFNGHSNYQKITCVDMHTGGEPLRIPIEGLPEISGKTVLEKRSNFQKNYDHIRTGLMFEPKGHSDMYGAIISDPTTPEADFDVFFIHNEGYSTMCGHAIIALTKFVFETKLLEPKEHLKLTINVPAGKIVAKAEIKEGLVTKSSFINVPSFLYLQDKSIEIGGFGNINIDIAFGGAFYAFVDADQLNISLHSSNYNELISLGKKIKNAVSDKYKIVHPTSPDLSFLYGTIFTGKPEVVENHSRNVCIFADGELDRSATGSGVSARAGLHYSKGELRANEKITIESILGSTMTVEIVDTAQFHGYKSVVPRVSGSAFFVGKNEYWFDPTDPFNKGFLLR